jgi:hypothetical protein
MRRWFVVLLIVLLPWRAWAGDAMVLSMAAAPEQDQAVAGTVPTSHCADHTAADTATPAEPALHATCDICNGPLLATTPWAAAGPEPLPPSRLTAGAVRFASALPHPGHKPPIS